MVTGNNPIPGPGVRHLQDFEEKELFCNIFGCAGISALAVEGNRLWLLSSCDKILNDMLWREGPLELEPKTPPTRTSINFCLFQRSNFI